jgi:hypothetical protein
MKKWRVRKNSAKELRIMFYITDMYEFKNQVIENNKIQLERFDKEYLDYVEEDEKGIENFV